MARWQYLLIIVNIFSTTYLGLMQYVEKDTFGESKYLKEFAEFTVNNRPLLAICFGILTGVLSSIIVLIQPYLTTKEFRDSLMDGIFEQVLDNDKTKARITIFCDARWYRRWYYRVLDFVGLWRKGWQIKSILKYCWEAEYIYIFKRWGTEYKQSKTHFCFNSETPTKCQGVAAQVRQREEMVVVSLPNISELDSNDFVETNQTIQEYMRRGYIADFSVLKSIKRISPFIYGNIITAKGGKKKLVLVIDSWNNSTPFTQRNIKHLSWYVKQISATFGK